MPEKVDSSQRSTFVMAQHEPDSVKYTKTRCERPRSRGPFRGLWSGIYSVNSINREMQHSNTRNLIFDIPQIIAYTSQGTTLMPVDLIPTGTPFGVGFSRKPPVYLKDGDECVREVDKVSAIRNRMRVKYRVSARAPRPCVRRERGETCALATDGPSSYTIFNPRQALSAQMPEVNFARENRSHFMCGSGLITPQVCMSVRNSRT